MPDVLGELDYLSWRGIEVPAIARRMSHAHEQVNHPLMYADGELVETTGAKNATFEYTIPFREGIFKGPWKNLFVRVFLDQFVPAYNDRTPGPLYDPIRGEWRCKPMSMIEETDVRRRDGEDVQVVFQHAPEQDTSEDTPGELGSIEAVDEQSKFLDAAFQVAMLEQDLDVDTTLFNPLDVITGIGSQAALAVDLVAAKLDGLAYRAEKMEDQLRELEDVKNMPVIRSLRRLRRASGRISQRLANPARVPITIPVPADMAVTSFTSLYNITLPDFLRLNPRVGSFLKQGQSVKVYPNAGPL